MKLKGLLKPFLGLLFALVVAIPALWVNSALLNRPEWAVLIVIGAILTIVPDQLPQVKAPLKWLRLAAFLLLIIVFWLTGSDSFSSFVHVITILLLCGLSLLYHQPDGVTKIAAATFGIVMAVIIAEVGAGVILSRAQAIKTQAAAPTATPTAVAASPTITSTVPPTSTPDPLVTPTLTPTPAPSGPVAGRGYVEFDVDGGQPAWADVTGYGPRINSVAHAYMYDDKGQLLYDNHVPFNAKGYRGPEADYTKPPDVYRILIIGDSFVEALQVNYEETFYARLIQRLAPQHSGTRRFEVIPIGRMGWGTLQEYLYYQVEGYKYNADLVLDMFYINDVADNYPRFFYPGINNTNYDYIFDGDNVRLVDTNVDALPPTTARKLYNALPPVLQGANLARLLIKIFDPPPTTVTPGGVLTRVHPQFFIYVKSPEPEGYAEGWKRTDWALKHFAQAVTKNGARFAVVSIFIGAEQVENVSHWFPDQTQGWQWDANLPDEKLADILAGQPATLIQTRPAYEAYAKQVGGQVFPLIFVPFDGHWNALGHQLTADLLYDWLVQQGIITS